MSAHHPLLLRTSRHGCWAECSCGWLSELWTSAIGAHLAFGQHLIATGSLAASR